MRYLLLILALALTGCNSDMPPPYQHKYAKGEMVVLKLDGTRAMVVDRGLFTDEVRIRLPGGRGESVVVREFELAPAY